jgi:hypothetical protein
MKLTQTQLNPLEYYISYITFLTKKEQNILKKVELFQKVVSLSIKKAFKTAKNHFSAKEIQTLGARIFRSQI